MKKPILTCSFAGLNIHDGNPQTGKIVLANEQSFANTFQSQELTAYAGGYNSDQGLEEMLNMVAPEVMVARKFDYRTWSNADAFAIEADGSDIRALNAQFRIVSDSGEVHQGKTYNKGLTTIIDLDEEAGDSMVENRKTARLMRILMRMEIVRAKTLLTIGSATKKWSAGTGQTIPDADLAAALVTGADAVGLTPNRIVMDDGAWALRFGALLGATNSATGALATLTPEALASVLGVDKVYVGKDRVAAGSARNNLLGSKKVYIFNAQDAADREDPSTIKRFVSAPDGVKWGVYRREIGSRLVELTVCHWSNVVLTSSTGASCITVS